MAAAQTAATPRTTTRPLAASPSILNSPISKPFFDPESRLPEPLSLYCMKLPSGAEPKPPPVKKTVLGIDPPVLKSLLPPKPPLLLLALPLELLLLPLLQERPLDHV